MLVLATTLMGYASKITQAQIVPAPIGTSDAVIFEPNSGAALFGYDPVDYFIKGRAVAGKPEIIHNARNLIWRFSNAGNREAFIASPSTYIPLYGGYDPLEVAAGRLVGANPEIFSILGQSLLMFRSESSKQKFIGDPTAQAAAEQNWPNLSRELVRPRP